MIDIGWVAGIVEGEGTIGITRSNSIKVAVLMTDQDVVEKLANIWNCTVRLSTRTRLTKNGVPEKDIFRAEIYGRNAAQWLMTLFPLFGIRRREKAIEAITFWKLSAFAKEERTHCPKGHSYDIENTYYGTQRNGKYKLRQCKTCIKARNRARNIGIGYIAKREALAMLLGEE